MKTALVVVAALLFAAVNGFSLSRQHGVNHSPSYSSTLCFSPRRHLSSPIASAPSSPSCHSRNPASSINTPIVQTKALQTSSRLLATTSTSSDAGVIFDDSCDVLVIGSGPAGCAIASLLSRANKDVLLADQNLDRTWPPNYGVWQDEWKAILDRYSAAGVKFTGGKVGQAVDRAWSKTDCYFGGSFDIPTEQRTRIDRPYFRVDRNALKESLSTGYRTIQANHVSQAIAPNVYTPAGSLMHDESGTTIQLKKADGNVLTVRSKLVVDCTGHETKLVLRETREPSRPPGFQIAYGCLVDVEESSDAAATQIGPYDKEAMTLFDYRTDHYDDTRQGGDDDDSLLLAKVAKAPTFMYAMPLQGNQIFFEETSLVARPAISFQECKNRFERRMEHLGIKVTKLYEEEFCYIPMGGALPAKDQRIMALGGAAAMVHPSTGYHLCRCLMGASDMSKAILRELGNDKPNLDRAAASAYHAIWSPSNIRQRNFAVFGGEFLMKQNVEGLRGFFDGFFRLPLPLWAGFLAGWPGLPNNENHETWSARLWFGLNFVYRLPPSVALDMFLSIVGYIIAEGVPLAQSVTPLLGEPDSYEYKRNKDNLGDVAAKQEAREMIQESKVTVDLPVDFEVRAPPTGSQSDTAIPVPVSGKPVEKVEATESFQ